MNKEMTTNVTLVGVGGQGTLLTSDLLAKTAARAGRDVKKSEIHGMAQRGGSVVSEVRFGENVASPIIQSGRTDILVSFDKLEALRWAHLVGEGGKAVVADTYLVPVTVSSGQQKEVDDLDEKLAASLPGAIIVDAARIAREEVGNERTMNMVLAGALSTLTPFSADDWKDTMRESFTGAKAKLLDLNIKAFELGRSAALG